MIDVNKELLGESDEEFLEYKARVNKIADARVEEAKKELERLKAGKAQHDRAFAEFSARRDAERQAHKSQLETSIRAYITGVTTREGTERIVELRRFLKEVPFEYFGLKTLARYELALELSGTFGPESAEAALNELALARDEMEENNKGLTQLLNGLEKVIKTEQEKIRGMYAKGVFACEVSEEAEQAYKSGRTLIEQGKHKAGREELKRYLELLPAGFSRYELHAHEELAWSYWTTKEYDSALYEIRLARQCCSIDRTPVQLSLMLTIEEKIRAERKQAL